MAGETKPSVPPKCDVKVILPGDGFDKEHNAPSRTWISIVEGRPIRVGFEAHGHGVLDIKLAQRDLLERTESTRLISRLLPSKLGMWFFGPCQNALDGISIVKSER